MQQISDERFDNLVRVADHRRGHLLFRLVSTAVITGAFLPVAGPVASIAWAGTYAATQIVEVSATHWLHNAPTVHRGRAFVTSAASVLLGVGAFAAIAVLWALAGGLGIVFAICLLAGSIMHNLSFTHLDRVTLAVLNIPMAIALITVPVIVVFHHNAWDCLRAIIAVGLMSTCAVKVWKGLRAGAERERVLHDELRDALLTAEAGSRAKSAFLATMSHELRTPLNGIMGMSQVLEAGELVPARLEKLRIITRSAETLRVILDDVLDMSKIESGKLVLEHVDFDLQRLLDDTAAHFAPIAEGKGLILKTRSDGVGTRTGDPVRVRQVITNLLSNAIKFTHHGSVEIIAWGGANHVRLEVSDSGIGISAAEQESLFAKFTQADASTTRRYGGTGLGLSITKELVQSMGGSINVRSTPAIGSTFLVHLPLPASQPSEAVHADSAALLPEVSGLRVLAAEDNPTNQMVIAAMLAAAGIVPTMVSNGQETIEAWADQEWDVILLDVQMPVMDGLSAARLIRAGERTTGRARTPIIAVTADGLEEQINRYRAAGFDEHVTKPIVIDELFGAIERVLQPALIQEPAAMSVVGLAQASRGDSLH